MKKKEKLIIKILSIEKDVDSMILLKALESILSIDKVVESLNMEKSNNYDDVIDAFREKNLNNYLFFIAKFKDYYSFEQEDNRVDEVLFNYFIEEKTIDYLKEQLKKLL